MIFCVLCVFFCKCSAEGEYWLWHCNLKGLGESLSQVSMGCLLVAHILLSSQGCQAVDPLTWGIILPPLTGTCLHHPTTVNRVLAAPLPALRLSLENSQHLGREGSWANGKACPNPDTWPGIGWGPEVVDVIKPGAVRPSSCWPLVYGSRAVWSQRSNSTLVIASTAGYMSTGHCQCPLRWTGHRCHGNKNWTWGHDVKDAHTWSESYQQQQLLHLNLLLLLLLLIYSHQQCSIELFIYLLLFIC